MPEHTAEFSWTTWHGHPSVVVGLIALVGIYLLVVGPLGRRLSRGEEVPGHQVAAFLAGVLVLFVALLSPLHELGDKYLFSAHMVQHLLLMLVLPPLLMLGTPGWMLRPLVLWSPRALSLALFLTRPLVAFLLFGAVLVLWHVPSLYDLTLRERDVHILEHLTFIGVALLMWWPILGRVQELPRPSYLFRILYLFLLPTVPSFVGAGITFSDSVLYKWYAEAPRVWGISAHTDQQVGGVIMWVPGGVVFLLTFVVVFLMWAHQEETASRSQGTRLGR